MSVVIASKALRGLKIEVTLDGDVIEDMAFYSSGNALPQSMFDKVFNSLDDVTAIFDTAREDAYYDYDE